MKNGMHKELEEIIRNNNKLFIPYSTAHIGDNEFTEYYNNFLRAKSKEVTLGLIQYILRNCEPIEEVHDDCILRTYYCPYFLFNFFNKVITIIPQDEKEPTSILLSRYMPTNAVTYVFEIIELVNELSLSFGEDIYKLGTVNEDEFSDNEWIGRSWKHNDIILILVLLNGHFQLYFNFE